METPKITQHAIKVSECRNVEVGQYGRRSSSSMLLYVHRDRTDHQKEEEERGGGRREEEEEAQDGHLNFHTDPGL